MIIVLNLNVIKTEKDSIVFDPGLFCKFQSLNSNFVIIYCGGRECHECEPESGFESGPRSESESGPVPEYDSKSGSMSEYRSKFEPIPC